MTWMLNEQRNGNMEVLDAPSDRGGYTLRRVFRRGCFLRRRHSYRLITGAAKGRVSAEMPSLKEKDGGIVDAIGISEKTRLQQPGNQVS